ncbi:MAG: hypothetical protein ACFUZC_19530 [Chthoniobacteraceae bacterium]
MITKNGRAFSLVEIVVAMGVCSFVIVALVGLFSIGLKARRDSNNQFHAADLASNIIATRSASPTKDAAGSGTWAIPAAAMTQAYGDAYASEPCFVGHDGKLTDPSKAAYSVACYSGTSNVTGPRMAMVHLILSWPPTAALTNAEGRYETVTFIPLY